MSTTDANTITKEWVNKWSSRYPKNYDHEFLAIGLIVRDLGFYDKKQFLAVGKWKDPRFSEYHMTNNSEDKVKRITHQALLPGLPDEQRIKILSALHGVKIPMASSLLTAVNPDYFTVYDRYANDTLKAADEFDTSATPGYAPYADACRRIADREGVWLRDLDRALYTARGNVASL